MVEDGRRGGNGGGGEGEVGGDIVVCGGEVSE